MPFELTDQQIAQGAALDDDQLARLPFISEHKYPQDSPQEYECGCIATTRVTDRDTRRGEYPFEMRLARSCGKPDVCEVPFNRYVRDDGTLIPHHADGIRDTNSSGAACGACGRLVSDAIHRNPR